MTQKSSSLKNKLSRYADAVMHWVEKREKFLLVLGTFFLAAITLLLWLATRDLVVDAAENSQRELRAYISILGGNVTIKENTATFLMEIKNSGKTPAHDVTALYHVNIFPPSAFKDLSPPPNEEESRDILGPEDISFIDKSITAPPEIIQKVQNKDLAFFVWGEIKYRDVFDRSRYTHFRMQAVQRSDDVWALRPMKEGNEAN